MLTCDNLRALERVKEARAQAVGVGVSCLGLGTFNLRCINQLNAIFFVVSKITSSGKMIFPASDDFGL